MAITFGDRSPLSGKLIVATGGPSHDGSIGSRCWGPGAEGEEAGQHHAKCRGGGSPNASIPQQFIPDFLEQQEQLEAIFHSSLRSATKHQQLKRTRFGTLPNRDHLIRPMHP
ncbi:hypothetical protein [Streptomyces sp. NPDC056468]|uniref:hypothetical protein n=1 Tax=Streptomyces sp. NPDC056468 TaxID=3345830 RepID=UPI003695DD26